MIIHFALIVLAFLLLFVGAESLVRGASSIALRFGLSRLMVGLTIVAFGTSSPELVVSVNASMTNHGDIAVGNVIGSNAFNIAVILGLTALLCPIPVHSQVIKVDAPIALGAAILAPLLLLDQRIGRIEGMFLVVGIIAYTWMTIVVGRRAGAAELDEGPAQPASKNLLKDAALILGGLGILVLGSRILVDNSVILAGSLGVSEAVIGLTIVAAGTSVPELATSIVAALRKQADIAIGNVVGSNIFNVFSILGFTSLVAPIYAPGITLTDYAVMIVFSVLLIPLLYTRRVLHLAEGVLLLLLYGGYLYILWPKHPHNS